MKSALEVIAIFGGLLALTALAVPKIVAYTTVNQNVSQANVSYTQELNQKPAVQLASNQIPVLKVVAETPVSTIKPYLESTVTAEEIEQTKEYAEKARLIGKNVMLLQHDVIIGFYQLIEQEFVTRKDLSPWIAPLFNGDRSYSLL